MKVKLKHVSHVPGSEGGVGDIVEVDAARGKAWLADGSADPENSKPKKPTKPKTMTKSNVRTKADSSADS